MDNKRDLPAFLVRLLGLYWMISGVSGMVSNGLDAASLYRTYLREGLSLFPTTSLAWFIGDTVLLCLGIHLILKYEKVLEFLTPQAADSEDRTVLEVKTPCTKCGGEILHEDLRCQECGEALSVEKGS